LVTAQAARDAFASLVRIEASRQGATIYGSGFVVALDSGTALVLTSSHVIEGAEFTVAFASDASTTLPVQSRDVVNIETENRNGLALFRVRGRFPAAVKPIEIAASGVPASGAPFLIVGYPNGAATPQTLPRSFTGRDGSRYQFDRGVPEGMSGSPVVRDGVAFGLVTDKTTEFTYAVPYAVIREFLSGLGVTPLGTAPPPLSGPPASGVKATDSPGTPLGGGGSFGTIDQALNQYRAAYERMDVKALLQVFPTFAGASELEKKFADLRGVAMALGTPEIKQSSETRAVATCRYSLTYTSRTGKDEQTRPQLAEFTLAKSGTTWRIESVRFR
jgi:hypothetical protein